MLAIVAIHHRIFARSLRSASSFFRSETSQAVQYVSANGDYQHSMHYSFIQTFTHSFIHSFISSLRRSNSYSMQSKRSLQNITTVAELIAECVKTHHQKTLLVDRALSAVKNNDISECVDTKLTVSDVVCSSYLLALSLSLFAIIGST